MPRKAPAIATVAIAIAAATAFARPTLTPTSPRRIRILGRRPDRPADRRVVEEELDAAKQRNRRHEGQSRKLADRDVVGERPAVVGEVADRRRKRTRICPEGFKEQVINDDRESEGREHRHKQPATRAALEDEPWQRKTDQRHRRNDQNEAEERINPVPVRKHEKRVGSQDREASMRQVDDPHHGEHEGKAARDHGIVATEQDALKDLVEEDHVRRSSGWAGAQAEISLRHLLSGERARRSLDRDGALEHADRAARRGHRTLEILLDQDHGDAQRFQSFQSSVNAVDDERREAKRNLIEQDEFGVHHQRAADRGRLLLAAGQRSSETSTPGLQIGERLHNHVDRPRTCAAGRAGKHRILFDGQAREEPAPFRHERDAKRRARMSRSSADVVPLEKHASARERMSACNCSQQGRLARPVGAHERNCLPRLDSQAHPTHGLQLAMARFEPFDGEQRHTAPPPR